MTKPIIGITANVRPNPAHEDINWSYAPSGCDSDNWFSHCSSLI